MFDSVPDKMRASKSDFAVFAIYLPTGSISLLNSLCHCFCKRVIRIMTYVMKKMAIIQHFCNFINTCIGTTKYFLHSLSVSKMENLRI
jgi:hypothetical protein